MQESRKQFEEHALLVAKESNYAYMDIVLLRAGDEYATMWVDMMWQGWKASRAAIEVELPHIEIGYEMQEYFEPNDVKNSIRAAGLKIKGE